MAEAMGAIMATTIIYDIAIDCLNLFENITGRTGREKEPLPAGQGNEDLLVLQKGFLSWASSTGAVDAPEELSLDEQLREDVRTRAMVIGLLYLIKDHLQQGDPKPISDIQQAVETLQTCSNLIRAPVPRPSFASLISSTSQVSKASAPIQVDDFAFEQNVASILRRRFGAASQTLLDQLAATIAQRNRQLSHIMPLQTEPPDLGYLDDSSCLFCAQQPASEAPQAWLTRHMNEHIKPYVCISEECSPEFRYYVLFEDWAEHMVKYHSEDWARWVHASIWVCDIDHDKEEAFANQKNFEAHMRNTELHPQKGRPSDRQLVILSRKKKRVEPRALYTCLFCGTVPKLVKPAAEISIAHARARLSEHIGQHIRSLAVLSHHLLQPEESPAPVEDNDRLSEKVNQDSEYEDHFEGSDHPSATDDNDAVGMSPKQGETRPEDERIPDVSDPVTLQVLSELQRDTFHDIDPDVLSGLHGRQSPLMRLEDSIWNAGIDSALDGQTFIPAGTIDKLITRSSIKHELDAAGVPASEELLRYILSRAKTIFAILACIDRASVITQLFQSGVSDNSLPLELHRKTRTLISRSGENIKPSPFQSWRLYHLNEFIRVQWQFFAPVFTKDRFHYDLHASCPLPFTSLNRLNTKHGAFSQVLEVELHPAHQLSVSTSDVRKIALKELLPATKMDNASSELETVRMINQFHHPHVITAIAAYRKDDREYFLFPWAKRGNLRDTWKHLGSCRLRDAKLLLWAIHQLYGLSDAIHTLHANNCRHGDLKPENILCFEGGKELGGLVIADVGLARFHRQDTQLRNRTTTKYGTIRYEPPDAMLVNSPRSRRYDIWSFGCILVEFVIWILYGIDELERFDGAITSFYATVVEDQKEVHKVNPVVLRWLDHMRQDPRCQKSALGDIISLTKHRLLIVEVPIRAMKGFDGSKFDVDDDTPFETTTFKLQLHNTDPPHRADASELRENLRRMVEQAEVDPEYIFDQDKWIASSRKGPVDPTLSSLLSPWRLDTPLVLDKAP